MDPITAGMLVGGGGILANVLGQQSTNQMNMAMVQSQENFQENMSNTAYQRAEADMEAAHLNPMMMFGSGAPASTPGGAIAPLTSPLSSIGGALSKGADTAMALRGQNSTLGLQDAQTDLAGSQADNVDQDTSNKVASQALIENQAGSTAKDIEAKAMSNQILAKTLNSQIKKANAEGNYAELNQLMGVINSGANSANALVNPLKGLVPSEIKLIPNH